MKLGFSLFLGFILTQSVFADVDTTKVIRLANKIKVSAVNTEASASDVRKAEEMLEDVVELLSKDDSGENQSEFSVCFEFVNSKYYTGFNQSEAASKATAVCKSGPELDVLKFLYEKQYTGFNASPAMDAAAKAATRKLRGKMDLVKFIYEKLYTGFNATEAATKAATLATSVPKRDGLECVKRVFQAHYSGFNSAVAVDQAVTACSAN